MLNKQTKIQFSEYSGLYDILIPQDHQLRRFLSLIDLMMDNMSIFNDTISSPLSKESVHDLIERIYLGLFVLNSDGAKIIHVQSNEVFPLPELLKKRKIFEYKSGNICAMSSLQVDDQLPGVPVFSRHNNRTAIVLDCSKLCRGDAIDFMNRLSKMDTNSKPIVIIMNITDIPAEDVVHDNPLYVERFLLH